VCIHSPLCSDFRYRCVYSTRRKWSTSFHANLHVHTTSIHMARVSIHRVRVCVHSCFFRLLSGRCAVAIGRSVFVCLCVCVRLCLCDLFVVVCCVCDLFLLLQVLLLSYSTQMLDILPFTLSHSHRLHSQGACVHSCLCV